MINHLSKHLMKVGVLDYSVTEINSSQYLYSYTSTAILFDFRVSTLKDVCWTGSETCTLCCCSWKLAIMRTSNSLTFVKIYRLVTSKVLLIEINASKLTLPMCSCQKTSAQKHFYQLKSKMVEDYPKTCFYKQIRVAAPIISCPSKQV